MYLYGGFRLRQGWPPKTWRTYNHHPRYLVNQFGLRNKMAILCQWFDQPQAAIGGRDAMGVVTKENLIPSQARQHYLHRASGMRGNRIDLQGIYLG